MSDPKLPHFENPEFEAFALGESPTEQEIKDAWIYLWRCLLWERADLLDDIRKWLRRANVQIDQYLDPGFQRFQIGPDVPEMEVHCGKNGQLMWRFEDEEGEEVEGPARPLELLYVYLFGEDDLSRKLSNLCDAYDALFGEDICSTLPERYVTADAHATKLRITVPQLVSATLEEFRASGNGKMAKRALDEARQEFLERLLDRGIERDHKAMETVSLIEPSLGYSISDVEPDAFGKPLGELKPDELAPLRMDQLQDIVHVIHIMRLKGVTRQTVYVRKSRGRFPEPTLRIMEQNAWRKRDIMDALRSWKVRDGMRGERS